MDESCFLGLANELSAKVRRLSSFVKHGPSIGPYHEEVLKSILEEQVALMLMDNVSVSDNPEFQTEITNRRTRNEAKKAKLVSGDLVPQGVQQMRLVVQNSVNDASTTAKVVPFRRR